MAGRQDVVLGEFAECMARDITKVVKVSICILTSAFFVSMCSNTSKLTILGLVLPICKLVCTVKTVVKVNSTAECTVDETGKGGARRCFMRSMA